jgi:hypothetical protein
MKNTENDKKEFHAVFMVSRKIGFEVEYYRLGSNTNQHFTTQAFEFNQPKTDYTRCGQSQELLKGVANKAYKFYKKWDKLHLHAMTEMQYNEMITDIEVLKVVYPCHLISDNDIRFSSIKNLSMTFKK